MFGHTSVSECIGMCICLGALYNIWACAKHCMLGCAVSPQWAACPPNGRLPILPHSPSLTLADTPFTIHVRCLSKCKDSVVRSKGVATHMTKWACPIAIHYEYCEGVCSDVQLNWTNCILPFCFQKLACLKGSELNPVWPNYSHYLACRLNNGSGAHTPCTGC